MNSEFDYTPLKNVTANNSRVKKFDVGRSRQHQTLTPLEKTPRDHLYETQRQPANGFFRESIIS